MTLEIGSLSDSVTEKRLGTVFAVSGRLALTAFHCVGDVGSGEILFRRLHCKWPRGISSAVVEDTDQEHDIALLRLEAELPPDLDPVRLAAEVTEHTQFAAPGNPIEIGGVSQFAVSGEITWLEVALSGASVIQLASRESAAELSLHDMSGAPVLVGKPPTAVGVIRWNPPRADRPELAAGAAVFATPSTVILRHWPQLSPFHAAAGPDLKRLLRRMATRTPGRNHAELVANISQLFASGDIGVGMHDLTNDAPSPLTAGLRTKSLPLFRVCLANADGIGAAGVLGSRWRAAELTRRVSGYQQWRGPGGWRWGAVRDTAAIWLHPGRGNGVPDKTKGFSHLFTLRRPRCATSLACPRPLMLPRR